MQIATYQPRLIYPDIPPLEHEAYDLGLERFIQRFLAGYSYQVAFYQFGKIRTPGISDIDLLIVTKDEAWKESVEKARDIISASGFLHYLFTHEPLVICETLLPSLPFLHTLENCEHICGGWDPLAQTETVLQDESDRIMRHVAWNSFMRMAALEMNGKLIGSRRALILMHNLLATAHNGNCFLSSPITISLDTREIRSEVLASPVPSQEALIRDYIDRIVAIMNEVDKRLDNELLPRLGLSTAPTPIVLQSRSRLILSPLSCLRCSSSSISTWLLQNVQIVSVPAHLVALVARLAWAVGEDVSHLDVFRAIPIDEQHRNEIKVSNYAAHFKKVMNISQAHGVDLFIAPPFSHRPAQRSLRTRLRWWVRKVALARELRSSYKSVI